MRTLLLAALEAIAVVGVLWVVGRLVEGMGGRVSGRPGWCAIKVLLSPSQPVTTSRFLPTSSLLKANGPAFSWL